jgi:hypothetical protein
LWRFFQMVLLCSLRHLIVSKLKRNLHRLMPITLNSFLDGDLLEGYSWTIGSVPELAERIGRVALGQSRHVAKILAGVNAAPPPTTEGARTAAISLLTVPPDSDPWHRDGWLFQTISWLAANRANPGALIRAPHMILAHKGFDGLQLDIDTATGGVSAAIIFEDKATDRPRQIIKNEIWRDFRLLEAGDRENVLSADVSTLLQTQSGVDADKAIENIIWKQVRRYRVSVTVGASHVTQAGRKRLFKGYDEVAVGAVNRRRGEILHID